jgi:hypothetical protein
MMDRGFVFVIVLFGAIFAGTMVFASRSADDRKRLAKLAELVEVTRTPMDKQLSIERAGTFKSGSSLCEVVMLHNGDVVRTILICNTYNDGVAVIDLH